METYPELLVVFLQEQVGDISQVEKVFVDILFRVAKLELPELLKSGLQNYPSQGILADLFHFFFIELLLDMLANIFEEFKFYRDDLGEDIGNLPDGHDDNGLQSPFISNRVFIIRDFIHKKQKIEHHKLITEGEKVV